MKRFLFLSLGLLLAFVSTARAGTVTAVAVVVENEVITLGEILGAVEQRAQTEARRYANDEPRFEQELQKLRDQAMEQAVEDKLVLHAFQSNPYMTNLVEAFIDKQIQDEIQRTYYGDRSKMIQSLHERGLTYEEYRRSQRDHFMIEYENYQNSSNPHKILISPLKVQQYFETNQSQFKMDDQIKLRMMLIPQSADAPAGTAYKVASEILAKIDSGVPFAEMAGVYSSGSQRAEGGDRGWVDRTYFRPELSKIAFGLKPGQHSGVIEQPEGCYLILVEDARPAHIRPLVEVRDEIERTLRNDENLRLRKIWIERLKRKSFISYY